ncbi:unnamed protein product [Arabis nemorensis]|uniref:F-box associated beta-propeller type 1 domain-containing protein n=1 Tax=Arabis nemorensis TaxID=586526 RepID=A0A565CK89_9BRAS|nr:unnamed protein product [Arabis nemorensis]
MVLSFDLHTETFQVIAKAPFLHVSDDKKKIFMCNLGDRLCVSEEKWLEQVIWSFDSDHKTWMNICSIDLITTSSFFPSHILPLAVLDKDKLLFYDPDSRRALVTYDPKN